MLTGYMALAAIVEERDLIAYFGHHYENYRRRVPMFIPRLRQSATTVAEENRRAVPAANTIETGECWI
jgi:hypothetical protein